MIVRGIFIVLLLVAVAAEEAPPPGNVPIDDVAVVNNTDINSSPDIPDNKKTDLEDGQEPDGAQKPEDVPEPEEAQKSEEVKEPEEGDEPADHEPEESRNRFTFTQADASAYKKSSPQDDNKLGGEDAAIAALFESLISNDDKLFGDSASPSPLSDIKSSEDDDQDDDDSDDNQPDREEGIENDDDSDEDGESDIKQDTSENQIRRQGDLPQEYQQAGDLDTASPSPVYIPPQNRIVSDSEEPLLQLTQGGYRRPYELRRLPYNERLVSDSLSQPSDASRNQPQVTPQVTYASPQQVQMGYSPSPMMRFQIGDVRSEQQQYTPNLFYNLPPPTSNYPAFAPQSLSQQYPASDDGIFSSAPFSQNSDQNLGMLFQNPFTPPQQQTGNSFPQPGMMQPVGYSEQSRRPEYPAFFRSPSPPPQYQIDSNFYSTSGGNQFAPNPFISLLPTDDRSFQQQTPRFFRYPLTSSQIPFQAGNQQLQNSQPDRLVVTTTVGKPNDEDSPKDIADSPQTPFGVRMQRPGLDQNPNIFTRYPLSEAGYGTQESLPSENATNRGLPFPFFNPLTDFQPFSNPDPYRNAQNAASDNSTSTDNNQTDQVLARQFLRPPRLPMPFEFNNNPRAGPNFRAFYPTPDRRNPFEPPVDYPQNAEYPPLSPPRFVGGGVTIETTPSCASNENASLCFEDAEYPRGELLYALNSDPFIAERLATSDQSQSDQSTNDEQKDGGTLCPSDVKQGLPLRAKNTRGMWKVIVNVERAIAGGRFQQPIRLEVCRGVKEPCSFVQSIETECTQKYTTHRLLSWSPERGVHNDVYKLPIACSCQLVQSKSE